MQNERVNPPSPLLYMWRNGKDLRQWGNDVLESQSRQGCPNKPNHGVATRTFPKPILNKYLENFPRILMRNLWKERNKIFFKQISLSIQGVWNKIKENVQESIASSTWSVEDRIFPVGEEHIFRRWNFDLAFQQAHKNPPRKIEIANQA
jgi:hypothetical protein